MANRATRRPIRKQYEYDHSIIFLLIDNSTLSVLMCVETNAYLWKRMMAKYGLNLSQYGLNLSQYGLNSADTESDYASCSNTGGKATTLLIGRLCCTRAITYTVN